MNYNSAMLKIKCEGLAPDEFKELRSFLAAQGGVKEVKVEFKLDGIQRRSMGFGGIPPEVWLIVYPAVGTAAGGLAVAAGKAAAEEAAKDLYRLGKEWLVRRFKGNPASDPELKLYGADGRLIERITKR